MFKNIKIAAKAGLASYLLSSLIVAILLTPYLSSLNSFKHSHSPNTAKHVHSLQYFVQASFAVGNILLVASIGLIYLLLLSYIQIDVAVIVSNKKSRAPPKILSSILTNN